jgi:hypothetical protein
LVVIIVISPFSNSEVSDIKKVLALLMEVNFEKELKIPFLIVQRAEREA